jgi:hypothetical protein
VDVPAIPPFALNGGTPPEIVIPVTNAGTVPLFINSFEIPVPDGSNGYFYVNYSAVDACPPGVITLVPGEHCNVVVSLGGYTSVGTVTGHLVVHGFALDGAGLDRAGYGKIVQTIN